MIKEEILVAQLAKGSDQAFEALFNLYSRKVFLFCRAYLKDNDESENTTQEVFIRIWELRQNLNTEKSFGAFVFAIAKNMLLNRLKRIALETRYITTNPSQLNETSASADSAIIDNEINTIVENVVTSLPAERQKIFRLSRQEGLSNREIAEKLNISIKTVENQMGHALKVLQQKISIFE